MMLAGTRTIVRKAALAAVSSGSVPTSTPATCRAMAGQASRKIQISFRTSVVASNRRGFSTLDEGKGGIDSAAAAPTPATSPPPTATAVEVEDESPAEDEAEEEDDLDLAENAQASDENDELKVEGDELNKNLKPSEIVDALNRHIVGQPDAKKSVAIAMRNRWRRRQLRHLSGGQESRPCHWRSSHPHDHHADLQQQPVRGISWWRNHSHCLRLRLPRLR